MLLMMLRFSGLVSLAFCLACLFAPRYLMLAFTHDPALMDIGAGYLRIAGWSYLMTGICECYLTIMKVTDHATPSAWVSSGAVLVPAGMIWIAEMQPRALLPFVPPFMERGPESPLMRSVFAP